LERGHSDSQTYEAKIKEWFGRQKEFEFMMAAQGGPVVIESLDDPFKPLH
jgi:hypothetical protein